MLAGLWCHKCRICCMSKRNGRRSTGFWRILYLIIGMGWQSWYSRSGINGQIAGTICYLELLLLDDFLGGCIQYFGIFSDEVSYLECLK